ncbi:metal ABC transporter permease [Brevibacillus sp. 7WMA2]|uniref:High-affinity zinc uptake system membrane protein ZnuB n=1 Tax=Brevibacillus laterosporus LMG 15441 TaxID=1042163 RepID=A0A075QZ80_BRELA|nr:MULTISPECIES: metal ABC transporter permease [Brevibacillus]AIG24516.1 high-affinity zinc uptake system membrane protein ZnuB [Brevibacillus laterosporus LMG 15441]AUM63163.1 metal ABC transporter permease [Brevibacillus laterosporus]AYK06190.1 metal ABC transporter permease [Brevibacillus laterosporus]ERM16216.1 metal ABC transporter permease [Brevibacillus laterosporus PE36]MBA4534283.1 metal ABC transporter permease [Brevibacillus halotolerans]
MLADWWNYEFLRYTLFSGLLIGLVCPILGTFLIVRRLSMMADGLSHVTLSGVAAGMLLAKKVAFFSVVNPLFFGMLFSVIGSLFIERLRKVYRAYQDLAIPIILSTGLGLFTVLVSIADGFNQDLYSYLFGKIVTVTIEDLLALIGVAVVVIGTVILLYKELFAVSFDEEFARVSGVARRSINLWFMVLVALTIAASMRIVGVLLISALITIPVAASLQIAKSFRQAIFYSILFAEISVLTGLYFAYMLDWASGGTIVLVAVFILMIVLGFKRLRAILR